VVYGNALKMEWPKFNKLVASIPYNTAEPLLLKLINCEFESCTLVVSKHFADLITSDNEHRLSVIIPSFFKVTFLELIMPSAFYPQPDVDSALIVIKPLEKEKIFQNPVGCLIGEIFSRRYSKLKNALMNAMIIWAVKMKGRVLTKRKSREFIHDLNLDKQLLEKIVDNMSGDDFRFLADYLRNRIEGIHGYCENA
jgi:16S rRNA (adenine1518-N6/adenine1519-N6)-dimethyltransferase